MKFLLLAILALILLGCSSTTYTPQKPSTDLLEKHPMLVQRY